MQLPLELRLQSLPHLPEALNPFGQIAQSRGGLRIRLLCRLGGHGGHDGCCWVLLAADAVIGVSVDYALEGGELAGVLLGAQGRVLGLGEGVEDADCGGLAWGL